MEKRRDFYGVPKNELVRILSGYNESTVGIMHDINEDGESSLTILEQNDKGIVDLNSAVKFTGQKFKSK